ncbi:ABC transporter substrate-binding protein [Pseudomonas sp. ABC1]|uniref:ABC transporter substrate-binding protein n=1 Tax=Pseudomonas sp. ABC1 TaxID=2748080 RepID=UPI0015C33E9E|nr:ABC transporter substrate-binding protein [Pseudomonas sp. ABC1]QLF94821.1 ABC transporter substrate-binding protein [Pseudomonas sp. ABC1]
MIGRVGYWLVIVCLSWATPAVAHEPLTLQLRWMHQFQFAGYYAALHKGFYRDEGLEVVFREGGPGIAPVDEVVAGRADFGVSNAGLVNAYLNGKPVLMLAPIFQHSPSVLLIRGEGYRTPSDLAGSGSILLLGSDEDVELKAMFINEGIALDRLGLVTAGRHLDDLIDGKVLALNAYLSNEPYMLESRNIPFSLLRPQHYGMDFYSDLLFTSQKMARRSPAQVAAFRRASLKGWEYALDHPDELIDIILDHYNTQSKTREHLVFEARMLRQLIAPDLVQIGHSNPGRWEHIAKTFSRFGMASRERRLAEFFYQPERPVDYRWLKILAALCALGALSLGFRGVLLGRANRRLSDEVHARKAAQAELSEAHDKLARFNGIINEHVMITRTDCQGRIVEVTDAFCRQTGFAREHLLGLELSALFEPRGGKAEPMHQVLANGGLWQGELRTRCLDGSFFWADVTINPLRDEQGALLEATAFHVDVSARKLIEQISRKDDLTGLLNRRTFLAEAERAVAETCAPYIAMAMLDADFFKRINDTWGHLVGDRVLRAIAQEILVLQEGGSLVGRFGGEEFVAIFQVEALDEPLSALSALMERVRNLRFADGDGQVSLTISVGLAICRAEAAVLEALLSRADNALYQAKYEGRDRLCVEHDLGVSFPSTVD